MLKKVAVAALAVGCYVQTADAFAAGGMAPLARATPALRTTSAARPRRAGLCTVNMGFGERFVRLIKANVNEALNKAEDPEKMLNQIVEDMQKELVEFRQTYAEVAANTKRMEKQLVQAENLTDEWLRRAKLALEKGDEDAARAALERKTQQEETANSLRSQTQIQTQQVQALFNQMQQLEQKISEAKAKKDQLKARAQTAKVSTKINDMLSKSTSKGALEAFDRMTEKVENMEAQAEVSAQLGAGADAGLERRFAALEANSKVDNELAALKGMLSASSSTPKAIESKVSSSNPKVDDELQKMKDMLKDK